MSVTTPKSFQDEPPRVRKFRHALIKAIPRSPNDRLTLLHMQQKRLPDVLVDYVNWASRYVAPRPRQIEIEPAAAVDQRWYSISGAIENLLGKVSRGDNLTPHLSSEARTKGYSLKARAQGASAADKWRDKDFLLTTTGCHHFHLGVAIEPDGYVTRTNDMLFAHVTRDRFTVLGLFDHEVFKLNSPEHLRLCSISNAIRRRPVPPGSVVIGTMIANSGHDVRTIYYARHCIQQMRDIDPKMDDLVSIRHWFEKEGRPVPMRPEFEWLFVHLDFGFQEKSSGVGFWVQKGWS
jgi:hypothetical protein